MAKRKPRSKSVPKKVPKVRIVRPAGRPFQLRYDCPIDKREVRISTGTRDEDEAERQKSELEARLLLGLETKPNRQQVLGPESVFEKFPDVYQLS